MRKAENVRSRVIALKRVPERVQNRVPVRFLFHIDEIDDDDSADIPETKLVRDLCRRFAVRCRDRRFQIVLPDKSPGIDVDAGQRLRPVDDQIASAFQPDFPLQRVFDLAFRIIPFKQRLARLVQDTRLQFRRRDFRHFADPLIGCLVVDEHAVHVLHQKVADRPHQKRLLLENQGWRLPFCGTLLDFLVQLLEAFKLFGEHVPAFSGRGGPCDDAHILRLEI